MKINKILIFSLAVLATVGLNSCLKDQEDKFDEPASSRMQNYLSKAKSTLENSEYGWAFDYFPDRYHSYGGFAYTVQFDDTSATVGTEIAADMSERIKSLYKMGTDNGPILSFDTYNVFMHYFATPSASAYEAMDGDFEFVIDDIQDDVVRVHGKRTLNKMSFHKLTKNYLEYLNGVTQMKDYIIFQGIQGTIDGHTFQASTDIATGEADFVFDGDTANVQTCYFLVTDEGIRFDRLIEIGETSFDEITVPYNDSESLSITASNGTTYTVEAVYPEGYRKLSQYPGTYWLEYQVADSIDADGNVYYADDSVKVTLSINDDNSGLLMSGLNSLYDVTLTYNRSEGTLSLLSQDLCSIDESIDLWICSLDSGTGYLTWSTSAGMTSSWNGDETNPVYEWSTNGYTSGENITNIDSFILWQLNGTSNAGRMRDRTYWIQGTYASTSVMYNVKALRKINE